MSDSDDPGPTDERARLVGINHVAIAVGDVDEALERYGTLFDVDLRGRTETTAFLDMGDQFLAMAETGRAGTPDEARHFGLVVDDAEAVERRLESNAEATVGFESLDASGIDLRDPWGNRVQVVDYEEIQFTKAEHVLSGMGLEGLEKTAAAREELAEKGLAAHVEGEEGE
ncbi:VOC family protein [Halovivax sp.]|uniref:VOC family protein n=1 Tax=Halovivax sp. TaxID=1935978 RepID=UPI0025B8E10C|nr:VOC family protein [Halovivax sp.]